MSLTEPIYTHYRFVETPISGSGAEVRILQNLTYVRSNVRSHTQGRHAFRQSVIGLLVRGATSSRIPLLGISRRQDRLYIPMQAESALSAMRSRQGTRDLPARLEKFRSRIPRD